ncbi:MAG: DUF4132 domain-containing protein [Sphingomonas sp.]
MLELPCGEDGKLYVARLDAALAIHLVNPEGKPVKALPAGDDEATRESAKALSAAKKELKQVIDLQAGRLFEAMCVERAWPVADWRTAFHEHPVMRRLVERLVWQGLDAEGRPLGLFRPTQEGDFTDATDAAVDIHGFARVRLAHGALGRRRDLPRLDRASQGLRGFALPRPVRHAARAALRRAGRGRGDRRPHRLDRAEPDLSRDRREARAMSG